MSKPGPKVELERVARVLFDAFEFGDAAAALRHNVSERTVRNYRAEHGSDPIVAGFFQEKKASLAASWIEATEQARAKLLERVITLASTSEDLRQVAGALKIVTDANVAERVVTDGLGKPGAESARAAGPAAALADAAGRLEHAGPDTVH